MKKILGGGIIIAVSVLILIFAFLPGKAASASEETSVSENAEPFVMSGSILKKYNGTDAVVEIPSGVTEIGPQCFKDSKIEDVTIPGNVKKIDEMAFYGCSELVFVTIEDGTDTIGNSAFANCRNLCSVSVPGSVRRIDPGAFSSDPQLSDLYADGTYYTCEDNVLYNTDETELVQYLAGREDEDYAMPSSVRKIDRYAFFGAGNLKNVNVSDSVSEIPDHAFSYCRGLEYVYLPSSVRKIGKYAFSDCTSLGRVDMERSDVDIADSAFSNCSSDFKYEQGVSKSEKKMGSKKSGGSVSDDAAAGYESDYADEEGTSGEDGTGTSEDESGQYSSVKNGRSFISPSVPIVNIDTSDPDLVGAAKVSGGNALVIPEEKQ